MREPVKKSQSGMTLIELMVALLLSLFLLGGLYSLFDSNEVAYQDNQKLTELVDSERFAMTVITEVTELGGYFPDPTTQSAALEFPQDALFPEQAAAVAGAPNGTTGDTLAVRFETAPNDGLLNCNGVDNSGSADMLYENVFSVDSAHQLVCSLNGATPEVLVDNVQSMTVEYGVQASPDSTTTNFDTYKTAAEMSSGDWANIACVKVTLIFVNPMAGEAGQPATIPLTRVIDVMDFSPITSAVPVTSSSSNTGSQNSSSSPSTPNSTGGPYSQNNQDNQNNQYNQGNQNNQDNQNNQGSDE